MVKQQEEWTKVTNKKGKNNNKKKEEDIQNEKTDPTHALRHQHQSNAGNNKTKDKNYTDRHIQQLHKKTHRTQTQITISKQHTRIICQCKSINEILSYVQRNMHEFTNFNIYFMIILALSLS